MCGIAGGIGIDETRLRVALANLQHRGPDGLDTITDGPCVLGQTRLSIIDLSPAGQEPFVNEDATVWLTFNGEIYNFKSLRRELEGLGHRFSSNTDAEVVLHGYEEWGTDCLARLRGMFAFAIWDSRKKRLMLARDRVGKKPLFFHSSPGSFTFASEIQGLLPLLPHPPSISLGSLDHYLAWGYVPAPLSGFEEIAKLEPAHFMVVDVTDGRTTARTQRYWSLEYGPKSSLSAEDAGSRLRELLRESVELRLISDVPLGAFLSGGVDSSVVVGLMAELSTGPVKTFSIGFEDEDYSELPHARRIADLWGTDHQEFVVRPDAAALLPELVAHLGEPFADSSIVPTYLLSKMTAEHVTVALNGDGGDESFAGYVRYWAAGRAEMLRSIPGAGRIAHALSRVLPKAARTKSSLGRVQRFLGAAGRPLPDRYGRWVGFFDPSERALLHTSDSREGVVRATDAWFSALFEGARRLGPVDATMKADVVSYLPFDLLVKVDIAAMANSLECRSPFLDHHVMEFAASLPVEAKLRGRDGKAILKRTFADLLLQENVDRSKMGFGVPIDKWLRGPMKQLVGDSLLSESTRLGDYLDRAAIRRVVQDHLGGIDRSAQVWNLLMLDGWMRWSESVRNPARR